MRSRVEQLRTNGQRLVKEAENLYNIEILRLPLALREMNWLDYLGTGRHRHRHRGRDRAGGPRFPLEDKTRRWSRSSRGLL